jgi:lipopolysaccharide export system protein LptA
VTRARKETRELRAPTLELTYGPPARTRQRLVAGPRGTLVVRRPDGEERTLVADRIEMEFENEERLRTLTGSGDVQTQVSRPNGARQKSASDELRARFDDAGNVAEAEQWGRFRYASDRWHAQAGRAHYTGASDTYVLREQPAFWDSTTRTTARVIEINDKAGTLAAEGDVRSTRRPASGSQAGSEPTHLVSDRLRAERERNWARYEGQARLWGGQNRLAADAIELFQDERKLVALGNVSGLFFEAEKEETKAGEAKPQEEKPGEQEPTAGPRAVTVTSDRFTYWEAEHRGLFEENVKARNDFGVLTAPRLEVFLAAGEAGGSESLERARAEGGVLIEQPDGRATSEQADYRASEQTVTLTGGPPKVVDAERGTVTGAELTLFLSDGTIRVNSDEGTRTVTRRRWAR